MEAKVGPCRVELSIESSGKTTRVDLGPGSCEKESSLGVTRDGHAPDAYFVVVAVSGPADRPLLGSDVVALSLSDSPSTDASNGVVRVFSHMPRVPGGPPLPPAPPLAMRSTILGEWTEIATGEWPDADAYRVLARVARPTS
jgi:hypothetical protein